VDLNTERGKGRRKEGEKERRKKEEGKKERRKEGKKERRKEGKKERRKEGKKERTTTIFAETIFNPGLASHRLKSLVVCISHIEFGTT